MQINNIFSLQSLCGVGERGAGRHCRLFSLATPPHAILGKSSWSMLLPYPKAEDKSCFSGPSGVDVKVCFPFPSGLPSSPSLRPLTASPALASLYHHFYLSPIVNASNETLPLLPT